MLPFLCFNTKPNSDELLNEKMTGEISTPPLLIRSFLMDMFITY